MPVYLNTVSLALLVLAAVAYIRRRPGVLWPVAALFFPVTGVATVLIWWPVSPALTVLVIALTLGVSLGALALFAIDVAWAPFCLEMTYLTFICWVLCPLAVLVNYVGALALSVPAPGLR